MNFKLEIKKQNVKGNLMKQNFDKSNNIKDMDNRMVYLTNNFTLPHLSDSLICTRNSISIVLLLQMMGGWGRWGVVDL